LARRGLLLIPGLTTVVLLGWLYYQHLALLGCAGYVQGLDIARRSPEVQNMFGSDVRPGKLLLGHVTSFRGSEFAEWSTELTGSKGTGHLYGVANEVNGSWDYSRLIAVSDHGDRVNLAPVNRIEMPRVPAKKVYLLPLGLSESIDWAPDYYKAKFGIDVTVLPPAPVDESLMDSKRNQLSAEKCFNTFMQGKYPEIGRDPSTLLVAVTSKDTYGAILGWNYVQNLRIGRFAMISSARLHPPALLENVNPEWLTSRLEKMLTKNIAMLYFDVPMSSDYTSMMSGGVLSGQEIDAMGGSLVGAERRWDPFWESGAPTINIYDIPGRNPLWSRQWPGTALPDTSAHMFSASLGAGLFLDYKADFVFPNEPGLQFTRIYRNQDDYHRAFGVGADHEFDMFLGGRMGIAIDLILAGGHRIHFVHQAPKTGQRGDTYVPERFGQEGYVDMVLVGSTWQVRRVDGWTFFFSYCPQALPQYVTVLTGFIDSAGRKYELKRDSFGALEEVRSPSGAWLHVENDSEHRIRRITGSDGRSMQYEYDDKGQLIRATASDGAVDSYAYDDKGQMLTAAHGNGKPVLTNEYYVDGYIKSQTMQDGERFEYHYFRDGNINREAYIIDPNGLETYVEYVPGGYVQSLPSPVPGNSAAHR
jgi:YD repeat-containing protein